MITYYIASQAERMIWSHMPHHKRKQRYNFIYTTHRNLMVGNSLGLVRFLFLIGCWIPLLADTCLCYWCHAISRERKPNRAALRVKLKSADALDARHRLQKKTFVTINTNSMNKKTPIQTTLLISIELHRVLKLFFFWRAS